MTTWWNDDDYDEFDEPHNYDEGDPPDGWDPLDCGLTDTGFCLDIGSEYCQFFCPYNRLIKPDAEPPESFFRMLGGGLT